MKKKNVLVSIAVIFSLLMGSMTTAFAGVQTDNSNLSVYALNENSIIVKDTKNNETSSIQTETTGDVEKITVKNLTTGDEEYFIRNNKNNTLYSSVTGYTGSVPAISSTSSTENNSSISSTERTSSQISASFVPPEQVYSITYSYTKISYKKLVAYVGIGAGAATILGGIVGLIGYAAVASVLTIITGCLAVIQSGLALSSSKKGVKVKVEKTTLLHTRIDGSVYYTSSSQIVGLTTY